MKVTCPSHPSSCESRPSSSRSGIHPTTHPLWTYSTAADCKKLRIELSQVGSTQKYSTETSNGSMSRSQRNCKLHKRKFKYFFTHHWVEKSSKLLRPESHTILSLQFPFVELRTTLQLEAPKSQINFKMRSSERISSDHKWFFGTRIALHQFRIYLIGWVERVRL